MCTIKNHNTFFLLVVFVSFSCARERLNVEALIDRCCSKNVVAGYLAVPVDSGHFIIIDNDILRARVYYDNYYSEYPDYEAFLKDAFMNPGSIDYCASIGSCEPYSDRHALHWPRWLFALFAQKYLVKLDGEHFTIKERYMEKWPYILRYCFDLGYTLYFADYAAEWIITSKPPCCLPELPDD